MGGNGAIAELLGVGVGGAVCFLAALSMFKKKIKEAEQEKKRADDSDRTIKKK